MTIGGGEYLTCWGDARVGQHLTKGTAFWPKSTVHTAAVAEWGSCCTSSVMALVPPMTLVSQHEIHAAPLRPPAGAGTCPGPDSGD